MKRTTLAFASAVALLMLGLSSRQAPQSPDMTQVLPLDFADIRTLRVASDNSVRIRISSDAPAMEYTAREGSVVTARREGSVLVLEVRSVAFPVPEITVPATVRAIQTPGAEVETLVALGSLSILSTGPVTWAGDAGSLRIDAQPGPDNCRYPNCDSDVTIERGKIDDLTIALPAGDVRLQAEAHGSTTLLLGPEATFSIVRTQRMRELKILPYDAAAPADAPAPEPTKIAP